MTVRRILELTDSAKPNDVSDEVKIGWLGQVEGRVLCEILGCDPKDAVLPQWDENVLSLPDAYSQAYLMHILAMLSLSEGKYEEYCSFSNEREMLIGAYARFVLRSR
jgi:hypothetical protein